MVRFPAKIWLQWLIRRQERERNQIQSSLSISSVLFVELTKFGDIVTILPAIQSFHDANPGATITVALQSNYSEILRLLPFQVEILPFDHTQEIRGFFSALSKIQQKEYDLAVSLSPGVRNGILTLSTLSKAKIGYFEALDSVTPYLYKNPVRGFGITLQRNESYGRENISLRSRKICSAMGIEWHDRVKFSVPDALRQKVKTQLALNEVPSDKPLVVIHPFAGWEFREWKLTNFLTVAGKLMNEGSAEIIMIGTQEELARTTKSLVLPTRIKLFESENILFLLVLYEMASLYIGNDSGPLHLASLAGVPCVGLFGPAPPELTAPIGERNIHCYHRLQCSPCNQMKCIHPDHPCMDYITTDEVFNASRQLLRTGVHAA